MINIKREKSDLLPDYIRIIAGSPDPVFRTCEILTRIDNLFKEDGRTPLTYHEKILILKNLKKGLSQTLKETYLINPAQGDPNRSILGLIDGRIEEYSFKKSRSPQFPRIYERKSWWR